MSALKKLLSFAIVLTLAAGCNYIGDAVSGDESIQEDDRTELESTPNSEAEAEIPIEDVRVFLSKLFQSKETGLWQCVYSADGEQEYVELVEALPAADLTTVAAALNEYFQTTNQPTIKLSNTEADTATVTVSNDERLGDRMGSSGASCYLATVTYSLTSVAGVDYVWFDIAEGSHAMPGRYSRADFSELWPLQTLEEPAALSSKR